MSYLLSAVSKAEACGNSMIQDFGRLRSCRLPVTSFVMADFKKLDVWQKARELTVDTVRASDGMSGNAGAIVKSQLVRSIMSVPANIAEGSAKQSDREFARFVRISLGSVSEAESHLIIANDLELVAATDFDLINPQIEDVRKMLNGLVKRLTADAARSTRRSR